MISIEKYNPVHKQKWDTFVEKSKNGTFMLKRDYMDYHKERFTDFSLMAYENNSLICVIPATVQGDEVCSHGGLTYGGFVFGDKMTVQKMMCVCDAVLTYLKRNNISTFIYKRIPVIYYTYPCDEDLYALFRNGATLYRRDVSTAIYLPARITFSQRRKRNIKKAKQRGLVFRETDDYVTYMNMLNAVLQLRHGVQAVHGAEEIKRLSLKFPDNIKLYAAYDNERMLAGTLVYINKGVVHTQYLANSEEGCTCGALDFVLDKLINEIYTDKQYFDFGISTENAGTFLNEGLLEQKQEFGGRAIVYDFYKIVIADHAASSMHTNTAEL